MSERMATSHAGPRVGGKLCARVVTDPPRGKAAGGVTPQVMRRAQSRRLGSKANEATWKTIINQMPPHRTYIEPFLGWGAIMLHKAPANHSFCLDKESEKVNNFLLELTTAHPTIGSGIVQMGDALTSIRWSKEVIKSKQGSTCALLVADALSFLASYRWQGDELVYCDPPYLPETRSSARSRYLFDMNEAEHHALLDILTDIPTKIILSGYHSKLYEERLRDWRVVTYIGNTRRGPRTEYLWCNFPEPIELHDYRYLGRNFRERQDLNRMRKRWVAKLAKMPLLKRRALLAAIKESNLTDGRTR